MGGDHFNEPVNQFGSKTGTVHIELLREKIVDLFHVRRNRLGIGRRGEGFQFLLQAGDLVVCLFAKGLVAKDWRSVLQFTPVENAVGRTAAAEKF
ncbi:hypothetical protein [Faecalibacterium prausnitzii]|uniref:Uncharacterized protein n=1 Tax=Faecalibacterium prausnitzii M21/2 TaxID=411485 RepID=A8SDW8_9FIRM|nr:hypothetical protein [Faecalibacterium prausnitzii]EDP21027.1 hypothetical protein FAEPRAM212_02355 [Faecalibacterium prausnitzii M21/2]